MSKTWEFLIINGVDFEFNTKELKEERCLVRRSIWDCYARPSRRKENIFRGWADWFLTSQSYDFTICGYNSKFFSLEGYITDVDTNIRYYVYITPSHNRAWKVFET